MDGEEERGEREKKQKEERKAYRIHGWDKEGRAVAMAMAYLCSDCSEEEEENEEEEDLEKKVY